jgi:hypothetical protein
MKTRRGASKNAEHVYLKSLQICDDLKGTIDEKEFIDMKARNFYNLGKLIIILLYQKLSRSEICCNLVQFFFTCNLLNNN